MRIKEIMWYDEDDYGPTRWVLAIIQTNETLRNGIIEEAYSELSEELKTIVDDLDKTKVEDLTDNKLLFQTTRSFI